MKIGIQAKKEDLVIYKNKPYNKRSVLEMCDLFKIFMDEYGSYSDFKSVLLDHTGHTPESYFKEKPYSIENIINSVNWSDADNEGYNRMELLLMDAQWNELIRSSYISNTEVVYKIKKGGVPSQDILIGNVHTIGGTS